MGIPNPFPATLIFTDGHASYGSKSKQGAPNGKPTSSNSGGPSNSTNSQQKSHEEFIDETVKKLLEKAGSHMEDTLVASYLCLIIGYLIHENADHEKLVRQWLPENNFTLMVAILKKFFNFMNLTASVSSDVILDRTFDSRCNKYHRLFAFYQA